MTSKNQLNETLGALATSAGVFLPINRYADAPISFNVNISAVAGTVNLQRSFDDGSTWITRKSYTVITSEVLTEAEQDTQYRITTEAASSVTFHLGN